MKHSFVSVGAILAASLTAAGCVSYSPPPPLRAESYANVLVGRLADLRNDHDAALRHYSSALERAPGDEALLQGALSAALASGDVARARELARAAASHDAHPPYAHLLRGADALAAGRWRQAREQLARSRGSAAEELIERVLLAWARAGEGNVDAALGDIGMPELARPYSSFFAYQQALVLDYAGRPDDARAAYTRGEQGGLWLPPAVERHADLLARAGARDDALTLLRRTDGRQNNPAIAAALARLESGGAAADTQLTPARGAAIGLYSLAAILVQEADSTDGLAALTLALVLDDGLDAARLSYAEAQVDLDHPENARAMLTRVRADSPYAVAAKVMESWVLLREEREDEALALARANVENGGGIRAERALADLYRSLERYGEAEPLYSELIEAQPSDWRLYFARGVSRERLQRWPEGEADLQHALQLSPDQPEVLNYLGYTWIDRGERLEEGLRLIQRAVEIRPLSGAIVDSLGWAYFKMGDYDQALTYLERAVELEPADTTLNEHLGDVYWRLGRRIEARFQWQRALSLDPGEAERATLETKIADGLPPEPRTRSATR